MKKRNWLILFSLIVIVLLGGCTSSNDDSTDIIDTDSKGLEKEKTDEEKIINMVMYSAPDTFNPYFSKGNYGKYAGGELVLSTLLKYTGEWELVNDLINDYNISDDGKIYTFMLKENVKWHDGVPFTAKDVAFTIQTVMHPDWAGTGYVNAKFIVGAKDYKAGKTTDVPGIKIINDYTIKIELEEPYAPFLEAVGKGFWILPAHGFEGVEVADFERAPFSEAPIGTGPLKFTKYVQDQYVEYEANEEYFLGAPNFDKAILRIMPADSALLGFEKGEIDTVTRPGLGVINITDYNKIKEMSNLDVNVFRTMSYQNMTINTTQPYFSDKRVRQAMAYAVDREGIVDKLLQGIGSVAYGPLSEDSPWFNENMPKYDYNPERGRELLKESGWNPDQKIILAVPKGNIVREKSAPIIQQNLADIGMKVELEFMEFPTLMAKVEEQSYDICLLGSSTGMLDPDSNLYSFMHSSQLRPNGWNSASWKNESMDEMLEAGAKEIDQVKRKKIYDEAQRIVLTEVPYIYLYYEDAIGAVNKRLKNAVPNGLGVEWNIEEWVIED